MDETGNQQATAAVIVGDSELPKRLVPTAVTVFALTVVAKAWNAIGPARALDVTDPITGIANWHLLFALGLVILWAGLNHVVYHREQSS